MQYLFEVKEMIGNKIHILPISPDHHFIITHRPVFGLRIWSSPVRVCVFCVCEPLACSPVQARITKFGPEV